VPAVSAAAQTAAPAPVARAQRLPAWWPLAALTLLGAALRLATLGSQSLWYDEAFTPVHVLHPSLSATLSSVSHTENSPPLWYIVEWLFTRVFGTGEVALRLPSALAGIAAIPVAWEIGRELTGRRAAIGCAALVACGPLFVWYSQEARAYELFVLLAALAMLAFLRALHRPSGGRMAAFAAAGALALLTHYFAVFLLAAMCVWLLWERRTRRAAIPAVAAIAVVGLALLPLVLAQGGHGTQWIGRWPLSERLVAIPQYYLTGASGGPLGHGVLLLLALPLLAAATFGLVGVLRSSAVPEPGGEEERVRRAAVVTAVLAAAGMLVPLALALAGADYLAPRNLVAAMVPLSALIAVLATARVAGPAGPLLLAIGVAALLGISIDVQLSPRLQRGDWRGVASIVRHGAAPRAITTVQLGSAPLEYYLPDLYGLPPGRSVYLREIDETGYAPLRPSAGEPPAPGFHLVAREDVHGLIVYRFLSPVARVVSERTLRRHVITLAHPEVLILPVGTAVPHAASSSVAPGS
jgi:4-amino-4-deoxy-L-arabinose transferase-like glycosyltransferase